ncbi:SdpI family protein [Longimicrobium terrae]|uniref:Putative membrane protein n=1 Tax=Longimicrobium terrae TaxID=1639882 RepID=A0A841GZ49_9BACT|nr:SdpI family protein [Longimicrobium terrae]MBB4636401.1 putative membrane protein [Longimicrobium terrae]MBB6071075.1 putative membrane protein [Longimicrobium terrae]NNC29096.1 DUF1648 domain-containing protein [Longimicrobium terrae]
MRSRWTAAALVAAMWAMTLAVYSRLPARIATHWDMHGTVDGWMPRMPGAFLLPFIAAASLGLMLGLPRLDPRRRNVERFGPERMLLLNMTALFMAAVHTATLAFSLGYPVDMRRVTLAAVGLLFVGMGNYLPRIKSNYFIGIRTPWTLENENVWRHTHRVGGRAFVGAGLLFIVAAMLPEAAGMVLVMAAIAIVVIVPMAYSYVAYRREMAGGSR